jgi:hypothetical protein
MSGKAERVLNVSVNIFADIFLGGPDVQSLELWNDVTNSDVGSGGEHQSNDWP